MDGERIVKLSGQGSVYIRCLEPFEEEDRDEDDEQLMIPSFSQCTSDLSETLVKSLHQLYSSIIPSKVIGLLKASPATAAETETLAHLKRLIKGLDEAKLTKFLRFKTASDVLVTDRLTITFTNSEGLQRRPIAHTCGYTLEVPTKYASFCELREEFMAILNSDSWEMNIV